MKIESPIQFLERTSSAVTHLLAAVDSYAVPLRENRVPIFGGSFYSEAQHDEALREWVAENEAQIERSLAAERGFLAEKYARATLCGSILQIAATGIRLYSTNEEVPPEWDSVIKGEVAHFCVGRKVRGVPLGLIVYAARNQYNHIEDRALRKPSATVFEWLATKHTYGDGIRDPAFDLKLGLQWNYPSNVASLVGWRDYETYEADIRSLLGV